MIQDQLLQAKGDSNTNITVFSYLQIILKCMSIVSRGGR